MARADEGAREGSAAAGGHPYVRPDENEFMDIEDSWSMREDRV
jgi:hypothetical protein